ncbi:MAG: DUF3025 domain-containing protein [Betaproteobacteria bacterium]
MLSPRLGDAMFDVLRPWLERLPQNRWPTHDELTALAAGITTARGMRLRFVPPRGETRGRTPGTHPGVRPRVPHLYYELEVAETGEVPTRAGNWHDLFNALAWIAFPRAKAQINAQHVAILEEGGEGEARHRSPARDALTLFDEGGVAVASSSAELLRLIGAFEWKALFWDRRAELRASMRFIPFGHGLLEQALSPYIGMVAKTVFVPVGDFFFMLSPESQREEADRLLAAHFAERTRFASPKSMPPMPVLGVPGWHPHTADEAFYDRSSYFRSKPRTRPAP